MLMRQGRKDNHMNKLRRQELGKLCEQIEALKDGLGFIQDDEIEYHDNIPDNLQGGWRYEASEEAIDLMDSAISALEEAYDALFEMV